MPSGYSRDTIFSAGRIPLRLEITQHNQTVLPWICGVAKAGTQPNVSGGRLRFYFETLAARKIIIPSSSGHLHPAAAMPQMTTVEQQKASHTHNTNTPPHRLVVVRVHVDSTVSVSVFVPPSPLPLASRRRSGSCVRRSSTRRRSCAS